MYFKDSYLRVVTPVTEDGNRPRIVNGQQVFKETALPLSAKKHLMAQNRELPVHLRKIIEEVHNNQDQPIVTNQSAVAAQTERKKPGPKPKSLQNEEA
jgi:hypothetical protein